MSNGSELKSRGALALRAAGYLPLPRLWVTQEQMALVQYMARQNLEDVRRIRASVSEAEPDVEMEKDAAWRQHNAGL